ncbi:Reverse transcriptase zinc-binding domain [Macleaya cordata]|uniref:Reverse transcriptase zinc-binding domain n=1 Tax=Macleaya cordata TaxID=56857 RepID=A0A200QW55_MACCD|nr:Reverse transcriptase zinc-binding domain [Macleaya cordata]
MARILNIHNHSLGEKYLGAPIMFQKSKIQTHFGLLKSVEKRIKAWSCRLLSQAGRTTLVKAVGEPIPLYQMATFLIPKNLILKAKYHARTNFIGAKCPTNASWAWKCLVHIKEEIKPFILWVVGDGHFIDPWCDWWIPKVGVAKPKPNTIPDLTLKVADCIDHDLRRWNIATLSQHFDHSSIEKIVRIPLSSAACSDRRVWDLSRDGRFSTKSAYHVLRGRTSNPQENLWKNFWRVKIPYRVQLFEWKSAMNSIHVREILNQRIHIDTDLCPYCQAEPESIMHALIFCPFIITIWATPKLPPCTNFGVGTHMRDWISFWLGEPPYPNANEKIQKFPLVACLLWSIWVGRNNLIHSVWNPPPTEWIKINTDGAWNPENNDGGKGFIVRNHESKFLFVVAAYSSFVSAEEAEVRCIWSAVKKAWEMKYRKVMIESDAAVVINQINDGNFGGRWNTYALLQDINNWRLKFDEISFKFIQRSCNGTAHDIAQWGKNSMLNMCWANPPIWLMASLGRDAAIQAL